LYAPFGLLKLVPATPSCRQGTRVAGIANASLKIEDFNKQINKGKEQAASA